MALLPPAVVGPLSECSSRIRVQGQMIGASVDLYSNGSHVGSGTATWTDQSFKLDPGKTLVPGANGWCVCHNFERPIPEWKELRSALSNYLRHFREVHTSLTADVIHAAISVKLALCPSVSFDVSTEVGLYVSSTSIFFAA